MAHQGGGLVVGYGALPLLLLEQTFAAEPVVESHLLGREGFQLRDGRLQIFCCLGVLAFVVIAHAEKCPKARIDGIYAVEPCQDEHALMILGRLKILYGPPQLLLVGLLGVQRQRGSHEYGYRSQRMSQRHGLFGVEIDESDERLTASLAELGVLVGAHAAVGIGAIHALEAVARSLVEAGLAVGAYQVLPLVAEVHLGRDEISRLVYEKTRRSPMILPIIMEV